MSTNTPNYNLEKPNEEEFYDVNVQNGNMDKIDSALKTLAVEVASGVTQEDLTAIDTKLDDINQSVDEINGKSDQIKQGVDNISNQIANKNAGKVLKSKTYTTNGTFTVPAGVTEVYITGGGAGGGGGSGDSQEISMGGSGTPTSFGNLLTLSGGGGGSAILGPAGSAGGMPGGSGGQAGICSLSASGFRFGNGGNSGPYFGGIAQNIPSNYVSVVIMKSRDGGYCSGGAGSNYTSAEVGSASGGGGGDFVYDYPITVTPLSTIVVTIGVGGLGGNNQSHGRGGNGGNGILTVKWWE